MLSKEVASGCYKLLELSEKVTRTEFILHRIESCLFDQKMLQHIASTHNFVASLAFQIGRD